MSENPTSPDPLEAAIVALTARIDSMAGEFALIRSSPTFSQTNPPPPPPLPPPAPPPPMAYRTSTPPFYSSFTTIPAPLPNFNFNHGYTPPSPNPYTSASYQQQPHHPYSQPVGAYQHTSASSQPVSSFQNTGSYIGSASYSNPPYYYQNSNVYGTPATVWNNCSSSSSNPYTNSFPDSNSSCSSYAANLPATKPPELDTLTVRNGLLRVAELSFAQSLAVSPLPKPPYSSLPRDDSAMSSPPQAPPHTLPDLSFEPADSTTLPPPPAPPDSKSTPFLKEAHLCFPSTEPTINTNPYDPGLLNPQPPNRISAQPPSPPLKPRDRSFQGLPMESQVTGETTMAPPPPEPAHTVSIPCLSSSPPPLPKPPDLSFEQEDSTTPPPPSKPPYRSSLTSTPPCPTASRHVSPSMSLYLRLTPSNSQIKGRQMFPTRENSKLPLERSITLPLTSQLVHLPPFDRHGLDKAKSKPFTNYTICVKQLETTNNSQPSDSLYPAENKSGPLQESTIHVHHSPLTTALHVSQSVFPISATQLITPEIPHGTGSQLSPTCIISKIALNAPDVFPRASSVTAHAGKFASQWRHLFSPFVISVTTVNAICACISDAADPHTLSHALHSICQLFPPILSQTLRFYALDTASHVSRASPNNDHCHNFFVPRVKFPRCVSAINVDNVSFCWSIVDNVSNAHVCPPMLHTPPKLQPSTSTLQTNGPPNNSPKTKGLLHYKAELLHNRQHQHRLIYSVSIRKGQQWNPGRLLAMTTAVKWSQFKQWDPGKFIQQSKFYNLEDKVSFHGVWNVKNNTIQYLPLGPNQRGPNYLEDYV